MIISIKKKHQSRREREEHEERTDIQSGDNTQKQKGGKGRPPKSKT